MASPPAGPALFFGKYRGKVISTRDPLLMGRISVEVPAVLGDLRLCWAMPCVPYAGPGVGFVAPPPPGANIWVEFEGGDPELPVWSGCFWGPREQPQILQAGDAVLRVGEVSLVGRGPQSAGTVAAAEQGVAATELDVTGSGMTLSRGGSPVQTVKDGELRIQLQSLQVQLSVTDGALTVSHAGATVVLREASIEVSQGDNKLVIDAANVRLSSGSAQARVSPAEVQLANGAASVVLSPSSVNVNNGALEVI